MKKFLVLGILCIPSFLFAQETTEEDPQMDSLIKNHISDYLSYGSRGFQIQTTDKKFSLQIQSRLQFRFAYPNDEDPVTFDDFRNESKPIFKVNRARLKVGGHGYEPWLKYYWEYELAGSVLLDYRIMVEKWKFLNFKIGQWKIDYTRERLISSGAQQLIDRSILNRTFTIDRQQGISAYGRVREGKPGDFSYSFSILTGSGRGGRTNEDEHLMYTGKLHWNVLGREVESSGSDLLNRDKPALTISTAAMTTRGRFTRFSSAGGGQLEGFDSDDPGDYRLNQFMFESAFKYQGFSWQHETHKKDIVDKINGGTTVLTGSYFQAGYFFHNVIDWVPEKLEMAVRYAKQTIPTETRTLVDEEELAVAFNYFFAGHRNKLTLELAKYIYEDDAVRPDASKERIRVQWEISF